MKSALKKNWCKIISVVCALAIASLCLISGISVSASSVSFQDLLEEGWNLPAFDDIRDTIDGYLSYVQFAYHVYLFFFEDAVMADREIARINIQAAWKTFTENSSLTADEFSEYWDYCINELGLADDRLILIEETIRLGFTKEEIIAYCYESDGDGISVSDTGDVRVTGSSFKKNVVDYWGDYYKPMYTSTQYTWSYQSTESKSSFPYVFSDDAPLYMSGFGNWGKKDWDNGVYLYVFYINDDNEHGTYYSKNYCHVHSKREEGATYPSLIFDFYDLTTGELSTTSTITWDAATNGFLGINFDMSTSYASQFLHLRQFRSYSDFQSQTYNTYGLFPTQFTEFISSDYYTISAYLTSLCRSSTFTPNTNEKDDFGLVLSAEPFELFMNQTSIDFDRIPDNYYITINGDTIYDYTLTDPETGDTSTINEYITNNYTYITNDNGGDSGSGSGTSSGDVNVGGNVSVSGDVNVSGQIDINTNPIDVNVNTNPIDINVNVNGLDSSGGGDSSASGVEFDEDVSLNNYYNWMNEQTSGFSGFMSQFFSWLPPEIVVMLCAGFACVILARFLGR